MTSINRLDDFIDVERMGRVSGRKRRKRRERERVNIITDYCSKLAR